MASFENQVAIITGASSGIGWAMARALATDKCKVGLIARRQDRLVSLASEIRDSGGIASYAVADVTNRLQTLEAIKALRLELGPVDLLIANAGVGMHTPLRPMETEKVQHMMAVNIFGVIYAIEGVLPEMLERGRGHLAAMSSLAGYKGLPSDSGYCASKAAVNVYLEGLRIQLRDRGIAVTTLCPGVVRTPMLEAFDFLPVLFPIEVDRAARLMVRALQKRRKVYNFPWQTNLLVGLSQWFPDWLLAKLAKPYIIEGPLPPRKQPAKEEP
jgi:short-subunit dehydrogenase